MIKDKFYYRSTDAPILKPSMMEIAWAAGIYEGEGSYNTHHHGHKKRTTSSYVSVGQRDRWICDRLRQLFGGRVDNYKANGKDYYYWRISGSRCRGFLLTIFSFLSPKKRQKITSNKDLFQIL